MSEGDGERGRLAGWMVPQIEPKKGCKTSHLEFPPGIEFLQALHGLLPVHHGGYSGPLLQEEGETIQALGENGKK